MFWRNGKKLVGSPGQRMKDDHILSAEQGPRELEMCDLPQFWFCLYIIRIYKAVMKMESVKVDGGLSS